MFLKKNSPHKELEYFGEVDAQDAELEKTISQVKETSTASVRLNKEHRYPGCLIVVEGIDGSGKSTQLDLLHHYLKSAGYAVVLTEWNSSKLISQVIKKGKKKGVLIPETFSLLHATDFADRLESIIIPALKAGLVVLADRYAYTAIARDTARNCDSNWVRNTYKFAIKPDAVFYFKTPVKLALERISEVRKPKYYEAGMDMKLSNDHYESFILFQSKIAAQYDRMSEDYNFYNIDSKKSIYEKQQILREHAMEIIKRKIKE